VKWADSLSDCYRKIVVNKSIAIISEYVEVVHQEASDKLVAVEHNLRLLASQFLL